MSRLKSRTIRLAVFFSCIAALFVFQLPGIVSSVVDAYSSATLSVAGAGKTGASSAASRAHPISPSVKLQDISATAGPNAPLANNVCFGSQTLSQAGSATFNRPSTTFTASTGCNNAASGFAAFGTGNRYVAYAFNVSVCTGTIQVVASTCDGNGCGTNDTTADTTVFIYQKDNGAPGVNGSPVFDPLSPFTNLRKGDNSACAVAPSPASVTLNICSGVFVVVVTHATDGASSGTYNLLVTATATGTCTVASIPTLVQLDAFAANGYSDGTALEWKTGREAGNLGFNVYREESGKRTRLNKQMLAGSALLTGTETDLKAGNTYGWSDRSPAGKNTRYWLEDFSLDGQSTWHGPYDITSSSPRAGLPPPSKGKISVLSKLGSDDSQHSESGPLARSAKPAEMTATSLTTQSSLAARPALKMTVKQEGWYRVTQSELATAGFDTKTHPAALQLFVDGKEQSFRVVGQDDGRLDAIEFYGLGSDSVSTNARTYWLVSGSQPGQRISEVTGKGKRDAPGSFPYTVERRDRTIYFSALRNGDKENFFGAVIARVAVDQSLDVRHLDSASKADATIELALQGVTMLSHRVKIDVNGKSAGELSFEAQAEGLATMKVPRGVLREGSNTVTLTALAGEGDVSLANYIRITYPRTYLADGNALRFTASTKNRVEIGGFTSSAIRVMDVTDPDAVTELSAKVHAKNGGYAVTVDTPKKGGTRLLWAFTDDRVGGPDSIALDRPSNLREPSAGADLVIISHHDFIDSVAPLKALRESQGLRVRVVDVEDVYDEFNFGQKSPQAIKDFLAFTRSGWETAPRFVLLVGDASLDPKGYLGQLDSDFVPTKLIDTALMETVSDDCLADFDGDAAADMAVGRLPVGSPGEAASVIAKIVGYDQSQPSNNVLLVADSTEDFDFEALSGELRSQLPQGVVVGHVDRGRLDPAMAQSELRANIYRGQKVVNYVGHGNINQWRGNLLTSDDARALENSVHLPLFVSMTCLNGYFQDPGLESLAEALIKAPRGGAIAVWASSGMTAPTGQSALNQQIFRLILNGGSITLGEATLKAKAIVDDSDVRRTWILFGDPTTRLR